MEYIVSKNENIDFAPQSMAAEVIQNVRNILDTVCGSIPLERNLGVSWDFFGNPMPSAINAMKIAVNDAIAIQEPRAKVVSITFEKADNTLEKLAEGIFKPRVKIYIAE